MRYIVFSFDDGMSDFYENALPILNKYGFKASINVIAGYSDKTVLERYDCLTIEQIKELYNQGFEMANHTNSHFRTGSYEELLTCNKKLQEWLDTDDVFGVVMPKYVKPSEDAFKFINEFNPPYVTYENRELFNWKKIIRCLLWKIIYVFKKTELNLYSYSHQTKMYKKGEAKAFRRMEVGRNTDIETLFKSFSTIQNGHCVTLCFHSIVNDIDNCSYPKGGVTPENFEKLCRLISKDKSFEVITQIDACKK